MIDSFETKQKLLFPYIDAQLSPCLSTGYQYKVPLLTDCYMSDITQEYCLWDACISPSYEQLYYYQAKPILKSKMNEIQLNEYSLLINSDLKAIVISSKYMVL